MLRQCKNSPDSFCYVCDKYTPKKQRFKIIASVENGYKCCFDRLIRNLNKPWAPETCCSFCRRNLAGARDGKLVWKIASFAKDFNNIVEFGKKMEGLILTRGESEHQEVMAALLRLSRQTADLRIFMSDKLQNLENHVNKLELKITVKNKLADFSRILGEIDQHFENFRKHTQEDATLERWNFFAMNSRNKILELIENLANLLAPKFINSNHKGLLMDIAEKEKESENDSCDQQQTTPYFLTTILEEVLLAEMKTIMMRSQLAYITNLTLKSLSQEAVRAQKDFEDRFERYLKAFIIAMEKAPGTLRACDPPHGWIRDETYFEMEDLKWLSFDALGKPDWPRHPCNGVKSKNCLQSKEIEVCWSNGPELRRYQWIEINRQKFGRADRCRWRSNSHYRHLFIPSYTVGPPVEASFTICPCSMDKENLVSLGLTQSNVADHKVITGARFKRQNKTLYIQIQQGKLLPNGRIDPSSQNWVPLRTNSPTTYLNSAYKSFILSDVVVPFGYVLVGVQFVNHSKIAIRAIGQKFDYSTRILLPDTIEILTKHEDEYEKVPFVAQNSIFGENLVHKPDSRKHYVELTMSTYESDVGQSMLPLFDGVSVTSNPPTPLGGIGLFHKGVRNYAGFISLRLHSLPYKQYFQEILRNFKPGRIFNTCEQLSCSFDEILSLGEKVYSFSRKVMDIKEETVYFDPDDKQREFFTKDIPKSEMAVQFNDIKEMLYRPNYYMKIDDLHHNFSKSISPLLSKELSEDTENLMINQMEKIYYAYDYLIDFSQEIRNPVLGMWIFYTFHNVPKAPVALEKLLLSSSKNSEPGNELIESISHNIAIHGRNNCIESMSIHHILAQFFRTVIVSEVKAMITLSLCYRFKNSIHLRPPEWALSTLRTINEFKDRFLHYIEAFGTAMQTAPNDVAVCEYNPDDTVHLWEKRIVISLALAQSDIANNMVITGLKFLLHKNVLHILIREGKLLPYGQIDVDSQRWVGFSDNPKTMAIDMKNRKLFFGNVNFLPEYAVVGLQFAESDGLFIKVTARMFDYSAGKLLLQEYRWSTDEKWHEGLSTLEATNHHTHNLSRHLDSNEKWILLDTPDSSGNDQQTVRAKLDLLSVEVNPPTPLGGVGIFYRDIGNNAVLISPRIFTPRYDLNLVDFLRKNQRGETFADL